MNGGGPGAGDEVRLLDVAAVLLRRLRLVVAITAASLALGLAAAALRPDLYTARTVLLPPPSESGGRAELLASQLSGLPGIGSVGGSSEKFIGAIARSRSLADSLVERVAGGSADTAAAIRTMLGRRMRVDGGDDGSVRIEVSGPDPRLAARVANAFPPLLNAFSARLSAESALHRQDFLERQLAHARERLERSEEALVAFQKGNNAANVPEQARRTAEAATELQRQIGEQEIQVAQLRRTSTPENQQLRAAMAELNARRAQLRRMTAGGGSALYLSLGESPDLQAATTRLRREYGRDEQVYLSLTAALAEAQIEANNNLPVVSVLDPAVPPARPSGMGWPVIGALAGVLGLALGLVAALALEHLHRARLDPAGQSFFAAWEQVRGRRRAAPIGAGAGAGAER